MENGYTYSNDVEIEGATAASLVIDGITEYTCFLCLATDKYGNGRWIYFYVRVDNNFSAWATASQEHNSFYNYSVNPNGTASLSVSVDGHDTSKTTYQWYQGLHYEEYSWSYSMIEGATSSVYTIEGIQDQARYYCRVSDGYGHTEEVNFYITVDSGFSAWATLSENHAESCSLTVEPKATLEISVSVETSSTIQPSFQWYHYSYDETFGYYRYLQLDGATDNVYTVEQTTGYGEYYCYVQDGYGNSAKIYYFISVSNNFSAWATDSNQNSTSWDYMVDPNSAVLLSVTVSAVDTDLISYQWYRVCYDEENGYWTEKKIDGATGNSYTTGNITEYSWYYCAVDDGYGSGQTVSFYIYLNNNFSVWVTGSTDHSKETWVGVDPNTSAELSVTATAGDPSLITYQWYRLVTDEYGNSTEVQIEDATAAQYTTENITYAGSLYTQFRCTASDGYGNFSSVWFYVYVENDFSAWVTGSSDHYTYIGLTVGKNAVADLSVSADAKDTTKIAYQWYRMVLCEDEYGAYNDYVPIDGAASNQYTTEAISNYSEYYCHITDGYGSSQNVWFSIGIEEVPGTVTFYADDQLLILFYFV